MSKQTLRDYPLSRLEGLQMDLDEFLQSYALWNPLEKVRLSMHSVYLQVIQVIEEKRAEAAAQGRFQDGVLF